MTSFSSPEDALLLNAREYLSFASTLMFAVGIGFVLPVFIVLLNFLGVLSGKTVLKSWRLAVLLIVFFAAVTTPAAEVLSMFVIAVPMILLFFIAVGLALLQDRRRAKKLKDELG